MKATYCSRHYGRWAGFLRLDALLLLVAFAVPLTALFSSPSIAYQLQSLSDREKAALDKAFGPSISKRKGPYTKNTCVCTDGRSAPVLSKSGVIRNICGEQTLFCAAFKAEWGKALEKHGVYIGNIFSRDLHDWDRFADHHDLVRGYVLEKFLIDTKPDHKLAEVRQFGGLSGAEYESGAQPKFFERYLALDTFNDYRHFLLAYEIQKRFFARGDFGKMQEVRNMASRIQARDPDFKPLRDAVHNQVSASLIPLLSAYRDERAQGEVAAMIEALIVEIEKLTSLGADDIEPQLAEIEDQALAGNLRKVIDHGSDNPLDGIAALGRMMVAARLYAADVQVSPADRRRLVDLNILAASIIQSQGSNALDSGEVKSVRDHLGLLRALVDASYGVGLIASREQAEATGRLDALLAHGSIDRTELLQEVDKVERVIEWAQGNVMLAFSEVWPQWTYLMPEVALLPDDILRGSPLLLFGRVDEQLSDFLKGQESLRHDIFGATHERGLRALNPGLAMGTLLLNPESGEYTRRDVLALADTPEDLQPTAGIITRGEGNVVSHVQLLARALGIPNAVVSTDLFGEVETGDLKTVFYAVTPGGRVILKEAASMSVDEKQVFAEFTSNTERDEDGMLGGDTAGKLIIDKDRLDLGANRPVNLASLRISDSGIRSGPKAAYLGELKALFPENVADGIVLPFGVYFEHYSNAPVSVPSDLAAAGIAEAGEPLPEFVRRTYTSFFDEMIPGGQSEAELADWIKPRLRVIRTSIMAHPISSDVKAAMLEELDGAGMLLPGNNNRMVGSFVRSDTNVEDLENFNGAGLNLTVFNLTSFDDVLEAVKEVWASPFRYRSFSWRQTLISDPEWVLPSIVILRAVPSEKSGVAISADINGGGDDKILIATSEGVGGAVDGTSAETLLWSPERVELITMFKSPTRRLLSAEGGSEIVPSTGSEYVLSKDEISQLAKAVTLIDDRLPPTLNNEGRPRPWDIEFGFAGGQLWLFQSRPFIGSDEVANMPALARLDPPRASLSTSVSLEDTVQ